MEVAKEEVEGKQTLTVQFLVMVSPTSIYFVIGHFRHRHPNIHFLFRLKILIMFPHKVTNFSNRKQNLSAAEILLLTYTEMNVS